jgi:hypothetical protein
MQTYNMCKSACVYKTYMDIYTLYIRITIFCPIYYMVQGLLLIIQFGIFPYQNASNCFFFFYSYVHTMFGSFLPPSPLPLIFPHPLPFPH